MITGQNGQKSEKRSGPGMDFDARSVDFKRILVSMMCIIRFHSDNFSKLEKGD
jgi:hypothetical protein